MLPGDILLVRGHSPFSWLVRFVTGSSYTHAALAVGDGRIIEADWGICLRAVLNPHRDYDLYSANLTAQQRAAIVAYARSKVGERYDLWRLLGLGLRELFHLRLPFLDARDRLVCSELIDLAYREAGVNLLPDKPDGFITPGDLAASPWIQKAGPDSRDRSAGSAPVAGG